jgi:precorrin-3B synthase
MNAHASLRRGACPGLSAPMPTGDGLLARLRPDGTMMLEQMTGLCVAAGRRGNGIVEITSRGSIQVRGLNESSAPRFANDVAQLAIAAHDGVPVITDPLAGLDPDELIDAGPLADELRDVLAAHPIARPLAAKISIAIDGGGALHLDALMADVRLRAVASADGPRLHVAIGGDAATAVALRTVRPTEAVDTVVRLLGEIARHGPDARARDVIHAEATDAFRPPARTAADPIGVHRLRRTQAVGIGFAFGHSDVAPLNELIDAARDAGATGMRTSPGRALLVLGVAPDRLASFVHVAKGLGFVVDRADPRRRVVACAGAPICASGEIAARALAPQVATVAAPLLAPGDMIHISGCAKGCAHRGAAALTAIGRAGRCGLLIDGAPAGSCGVGALPQRLAVLAATRSARRG